MGFCKGWNFKWVIFYFSLLLMEAVKGSYDPESLGVFFHDHANKELEKPRTGTLYNISLPANFSGMEVSVVRIRSGTFWARGVNFSFFNIPPRIVPDPYAKRLAIVYENLGNWSSYYYNVTGYSLVAPVVGFMVYDSSNSSAVGIQKLNFTIRGDPITVRFPQVELKGKNVTAKCVKFGAGGTVKLKNMTKPNVCTTEGQGHFTIVIPSPPKKERCILWWIFGFGIGLLGLILLSLVLLGIITFVRRIRIEKMERKSEKGVAFDTFWIGGSKMPSASMIRTQPTLENDYNP
ncbi:DUF1191 domain-containing protein [Quillaja saponaria]|uniref:DUF1191 domain-containing protein n=1 Tax=Quillaja saponaria TaxID=32244 RepID=A0AAD7PDT8_QUISA|nr:DUF1191 domain-containing protein [Quillaja saponaria]